MTAGSSQADRRLPQGLGMSDVNCPQQHSVHMVALMGGRIYGHIQQVNMMYRVLLGFVLMV